MEDKSVNSEENPEKIAKDLMDKNNLSPGEVKELLSDGSISAGIPWKLYLRLFPLESP